MTMAEHRASTLLGAIFVVFGINGFIHFLPMPLLELTSKGSAFIELLNGSGYFYVIKSLEVIAGLMILNRRYLPLGLALLSPVVVNIFLFHVLLDPRNLAVGIVLLALWAFSAWRCRDRYAPMFDPLIDDFTAAFHRRREDRVVHGAGSAIYRPRP